MKSVIRPMQRKDLDAVRIMADQLGYPCPSPEFEQRFLELIVLSHHQLYVLVDQEKVQGWIHLELVTDLIEEKKVEVKAMVVDEDSRGQGYGSDLLSQAREWGKEKGVSTIYLSCNIIRDKAHAFYLREGFKKVKTSHFFEMVI
ncbi:MAG: GNAT family N-acetyltransferase [Bacteriovoracia bacterium]